jgi:hypothetical protein
MIKTLENFQNLHELRAQFEKEVRLAPLVEKARGEMESTNATTTAKTTTTTPKSPLSPAPLPPSTPWQQ